MQYIAWIKSWGTQSSCLHLLLSDLSLAKLLPTPMDIFLSFNYITLQLHLNKHKALATKLSMTNMNRIILWLQRLYLLKCLEIWFDSLVFFCDWNWKCLRMSERYCGFILITMPGKNRISIARRCLPKAGTSTSWCLIRTTLSTNGNHNNGTCVSQCLLLWLNQLIKAPSPTIICVVFVVRWVAIAWSLFSFQRYASLVPHSQMMQMWGMYSQKSRWDLHGFAAHSHPPDSLSRFMLSPWCHRVHLVRLCIISFAPLTPLFFIQI